MEISDQYEIVVGLEVHAQLLTSTKLFCGDTTEFGREPNTQTSVVSLGHPGTLPRMNRSVIVKAVTLGIACNCEIVQQNYFARKNYFYPDLPKGYQVSQHTTPICRNGFLEVVTKNESRRIRINRIHMEEDAGKSLHEEGTDFSSIDCNRAGMPLLEIVTEPDIRSAEEASAFVTQLRKLVRHLGVCDGNMEEGSLRCDVNISVREKGDAVLGTRVEIKNLNSIRFIRKAIEYESTRLIGMHAAGERILQQTRGLDESTFSTYAIRTKEDEDDYRYFPEPDLPPFQLSDEMISEIRQQMPALPAAIKKKLLEVYHLPEYDALLLSDDPELVELFFELAAVTKNYKVAANWVNGPVRQYLSNREIQLHETTISAAPIANMIKLIDEGKITYAIASQKIFMKIAEQSSFDVEKFINDENLQIQNSSVEIDELVQKALEKHAQKIPEFKKGKKGLISVFVGEVMKLSHGRADARLVTSKIIEKLNQ
jgi:aspartyl-tRNA(Asn)/glutamyl-tRNA(Gln) amidotransferase subunit B